MNPPGHHPDAKDFVAVNNKGAPYNRIKFLRHLFYKLAVTETYAWGKEIFSPFEGEVIKVEDDARDRIDLNFIRDLINGLFLAPRSNKDDIGFFLGNYVVMESKDGVLALFAHLRQGTAVVSKGQKVVAGELIAQVGNSGNTIQPHLHFQLMTDHDVSKAAPVPFVFETCQISNKGAWESVSAKLPRNYERFRV